MKTHHTVWKKAKLDANGQRWVAEMSIFNYTFKHKPRKANDADYLPRNPVEEPIGSDEDNVVPICHVSATPSPPELGLLNSVESEAIV